MRRYTVAASPNSIMCMEECITGEKLVVVAQARWLLKYKWPDTGLTVWTRVSDSNLQLFELTKHLRKKPLKYVFYPHIVLRDETGTIWLKCKHYKSLLMTKDLVASDTMWYLKDILRMTEALGIKWHLAVSKETLLRLSSIQCITDDMLQSPTDTMHSCRNMHNNYSRWAHHEMCWFEVHGASEQEFLILPQSSGWKTQAQDTDTGHWFESSWTSLSGLSSLSIVLHPVQCLCGMSYTRPVS